MPPYLSKVSLSQKTWQDIKFEEGRLPSSFHSVKAIRKDKSAYEVKKKNCCLFERFFKVKKNGVFLFAISFFVLEIFTFLHYANEEIDDVIDGSTKTV